MINPSSLQEFFEKEKKREKERREWAEKTPATKADVEDAVNYLLDCYIREIGHWMKVDEYKIEKL